MFLEVFILSFRYYCCSSYGRFVVVRIKVDIPKITGKTFGLQNIKIYVFQQGLGYSHAQCLVCKILGRNSGIEYRGEIIEQNHTISVLRLFVVVREK